MPFPAGNRNLYNFRTIIGDHSRPHLFLVNIPAIGSDAIEMTAFARTTKLPAYTIGTTDIAFQGMNYKVATSAEMGGEWECEFLVDDAHEIRLRFLQWMGSVYDPERQVAGSPLFYKSDNVTVSQLNRIGTSIFTYQFVGLFPKNVGEIALDHGSQDPEKFSVSFSYDYFAVRAGAEAGTGAIPTAVSPDLPFMGTNAIVGVTTSGPFGPAGG
jgi:hypothetical protein